jgi:hypothetical protein
MSAQGRIVCLIGGSAILAPTGAASKKNVRGGYSGAEQIRTQPGIALAARPEIEGQGCEIVRSRRRERVLREIDGLDVGPAAVARVDADVGEFVRRVHRQRVEASLLTRGTGHAREIPFGPAQAADQRAARAMAALTQQAGNGAP